MYLTRKQFNSRWPPWFAIVLEDGDVPELTGAPIRDGYPVIHSNENGIYWSYVESQKTFFAFGLCLPKHFDDCLASARRLFPGIKPELGLAEEMLMAEL